MRFSQVVGVLAGLTVYVTSFSQTCSTVAPKYQTIGSACNSGTFTTGSEWNAGPVVTGPTIGGAPPYVLDGTNSYTIPASDVVEIASSNFQLNSNLIVKGTLLISGKLSMASGLTITVAAGGLVTCCSTGYCGGSCASCGASDKIAIGTTNVYCGTSCGSVNGSFTGPSTLSAGGLLPITLIAFDAKLNSNSIDLSWSTASEFNFDYFNLERSSNGKDFSSIATVKGHGTTNERHNYSFEDSFPFIGKNYYRLTSVDFDNYQETFNVIVQNYSGEKNFEVSPNPTNGRAITLNFNFDSKEGQVVIYDNMGSIVDSFQVDKVGEVSFSNSLRDGIYFVKYSSPSFTKAIRFLVKQ